MTATVPSVAPVPAITAIRAGKPISAATWQAVSQLCNYLIGRGACVIPAHSPGLLTVAKSQTRDFRFRTQLPVSAVALAWEIGLRSKGTSDGAVVTITTPTGGTGVSYTVTSERGQTPIRHVQSLTSQGSAEQEISVRIAPSSVNDVEVFSIGCWALPRAALALNTTDYGHAQATVGPRQPIFDGAAGSGNSLGALLRNVAIAKAAARRVGLVQLGLPDTAADTWQVTALQALETGGAPVLARKIAYNATTGTVSFRCLAWTDAASTYGELYVDTVSGGAATATVALGTAGVPLVNGTPTWYPLVAGAPATFAVDCEDLGATNGNRSSRYDDVTFRAKRSSGSGTIYIATRSCWEAP